jgi:hypothetical protein
VHVHVQGIQGELVYVDIETVHVYVYILCRMHYFMSYALGTGCYYLNFELYVLCLWTIICNILWVELCLVQITLCMVNRGVIIIVALTLHIISCTPR